MPSQAPLSKRNKNTHKNDYGHVLLIAGSRRMLGAACLSALAAFRSGAGLVTLAVPESLNELAQKKCNNSIMTLPLKETPKQSVSFKACEQILKYQKNYHALAIGPGLGTAPETKKFIRKILKSNTLPAVIDADALNVLAENLKMIAESKYPRVLTPHPGEMQRLLKISKKKVEGERQEVALTLAEQTHSVVLLKGHETVVAENSENVYINKTGNPGMATAGSGDCLTGIIAAFMAQGATAFESAKYGAYFHGLAGDLAARKIGERSLIAEDIIHYLPKAFQTAEE